VEGARDRGGGRRVDAFTRGGVTSGVGGLRWFVGVPGAEDICGELATGASYSGAEAVAELLPEDWREFPGGVGGRTGAPILLEVCFNVWGLDGEELCSDGMPVSRIRSNEFIAGAGAVAGA
jgi:hypothetical protein